MKILQLNNQEQQQKYGRTNASLRLA